MYHTYTYYKKHVYGIFMSEAFQKLQEKVEIPSDVSMKVPIITMIGFQSLTIENYRGIIEYNSKYIRIQTKIGQIKLCGCHLNIEHYTCEEMKVIGQISQIEYQPDTDGGSN